MDYLAAFIGGFVLCYVSMILLPSISRKMGQPPQTEQEQTVYVKRPKPSLRNPMRTYNAAYDEYKTKKGLFEPVRPKAQTHDDVEVGR